jgi:hypothetical protein
VLHLVATFGKQDPRRFQYPRVVSLGVGALRCASDPPPRVLQISSPGGWDHYVEDLIEAGPAVLTDGALDPAKINPIAAEYGVRYDETRQPS